VHRCAAAPYELTGYGRGETVHNLSYLLLSAIAEVSPTVSTDGLVYSSGKHLSRIGRL